MAAILIINSTQNSVVTEQMLKSVKEQLNIQKYSFDEITVPSAQEIPTCLSIVMDTSDYEGIICLGSICHEKHESMFLGIYNEMLRGISDFSIHYSTPISRCITFTKNHKEALKIQKTLSTQAVVDLVEMIKLKRQYYTIENEQFLAKQKHN
jgi:6,7-dimethyl-8-ribityllumazine synthase